eukprot:g31581.t1
MSIGAMNGSLCPAANTIQVLKMVSQRMKRSGPGIVEDVASRTDEALKMGIDDAGVETGSSVGNGSPSTYISGLSRASIRSMVS